ncbi:MAG: hypothetical protein EA351_03715 [Gemmatimonadales bacterium]|nr:MAG: hypothetical protein EA351_03715 [Gemmatimonadales bacterium]
MLVALRHPGAWPDLIGLAWAARRRGWWRRPPFLPLPPAAYLRWRNETAYGEPTATGSDRELLRYLRWAARMRRGSRSR